MEVSAVGEHNPSPPRTPIPRDQFKLHELTGDCNTPGVCHQLSNGFELKHGILSDDEDVKVNLWN